MLSQTRQKLHVLTRITDPLFCNKPLNFYCYHIWIRRGVSDYITSIHLFLLCAIGRADLLALSTVQSPLAEWYRLRERWIMACIPGLHKVLYVRDCAAEGGLCLGKNKAYVVNGMS